jgi:hypothetical protein
LLQRFQHGEIQDFVAFPFFSRIIFLAIFCKLCTFDISSNKELQPARIPNVFQSVVALMVWPAAQDRAGRARSKKSWPS